MKIIAISILAFTIFLSGCCKDKGKSSDNEKIHYFGNVKYIKEFSYVASTKLGEITKGERKREKFQDNDIYIIFDLKGNAIEENYYNSDDNLERKKSNKFDEKGNMIEEKWHYPNDSKDTLVYNDESLSEGSWQSRERRLNDNYKVISKYNNNNNLVEREMYNFYGVLNSKETYKYNEIGKLIEIDVITGVDSILTKETYKYDIKGNLIERDGITDNNLHHTKEINKYDNKGNLVENDWISSDGSLVFKWIFKYDNKKKLIERKNIYDKEILLRQTYKYDNNGNEIEKNLYDPRNNRHTMETFKYEFDKMGNWIKRIDFKNDTPKFLIEREIKYFNN
jgi:hypothetical protein